MRIEKDIFDKGLDYTMGNRYNLPDTDDTPTLDYQDFLRRAKKGKPSFDVYVELLSREMQAYDIADPYKKDALKDITDKADSFLRRHAGISYEEFLRQSQPETFTENDYGNLPGKKNLRRRLFEHRVRLYLSSLEDFEQSGNNALELLPEIQQSTIPYIKKERDEPTFREIMKVLKRRD